jgi:sterol desaturase/sphingolipid hydroxylase (fatty acid hydroxylase superfamily)
MVPTLIYAIPFFVLLLVVEYVSFVHAGEESVAGLVGYDARDTRTSLTMGLGRVVVDLALKVAIVAGYAGLYELSPLRLHPGDWWFWPLLFFADDFSYYWYHRIHHVSRVFWATHVVHHSSEHYNLSTALRQPWISISTFPFWMWLPLVGFPVWTVLLAQSWNLIYQFWIHTERIHRLPGWFEAIFNTPSHHRVHHGANQQYLDRNYAGELIIWDRLFGTFEPEGERVRYGLTKNIHTFNPMWVNFHEYVAIWHDVRLAHGWRDKLGIIFRGPGWRPAATPGLSERTGAP